MTEPVPLMERIRQGLPALTRGQRQVVRLVMGEPEAVAFASAEQVARRCGVSQATVIRTCQALGYAGYSPLQEDVRRLLLRGRTLERYHGAAEASTAASPSLAVFQRVLHQDADNLRQTAEHLPAEHVDRAVQLLAGAGRVFVTGARASYATAYFLAYNLATLLEDVVLLHPGPDFYHRLREVDGESAVVGVGFPRYTDVTLRILRYARARGAAVVAITDSPRSPLAALADAVLTAAIATPAATDSHTAAMSLATALLTAVALQRREEAERHAARFEAALQQWERSGREAGARGRRPRRGGGDGDGRVNGGGAPGRSGT